MASIFRLPTELGVYCREQAPQLGSLCAATLLRKSRRSHMLPLPHWAFLCLCSDRSGYPLTPLQHTFNIFQVSALSSHRRRCRHQLSDWEQQTG